MGGDKLPPLPLFESPFPDFFQFIQFFPGKGQTIPFNIQILHII